MLTVFIIDSEPDFRRLLMHHISVAWPDAVISEYDPARSGALHDDFAGASNDIVLMSETIAPMKGINRVRRYCRNAAFPPLIYFVADDASGDAERALVYGARAVFVKRHLEHQALIDAIREAVASRAETATTANLFYGEPAGSLALRGYELVRKLASGEVSSVYLTHHATSDRPVVLKVLRHSPDDDGDDGALRRFIQEYEVVASLRHPNIVRILDFGVGDDHAFIAMEYFTRGDLRRRIRKGMTEGDALRVLKEAASALAAMHSVGILHRDLKPGNIMCRADGSIALIDFGLAKQLRLVAEITGAGEIFGTPYYMSPEQGHGRELDVRSDIYSLGIVFYEMLTGLKPFRAETAMGIVYKHSHAPRPQLPGALSRRQALLDRMFAINPDERFRTADELFEALP